MFVVGALAPFIHYIALRQSIRTVTIAPSPDF